MCIKARHGPASQTALIPKHSQPHQGARNSPNAGSVQAVLLKCELIQINFFLIKMQFLLTEFNCKTTGMNHCPTASPTTTAQPPAATEVTRHFRAHKMPTMTGMTQCFCVQCTHRSIALAKSHRVVCGSLSDSSIGVI